MEVVLVCNNGRAYRQWSLCKGKRGKGVGCCVGADREKQAPFFQARVDLEAKLLGRVSVASENGYIQRLVLSLTAEI